jgi:hypothetical protein
VSERKPDNGEVKMSPDQQTTIIVIFVALLPTAVAACRRHHQVWAIFILNIAGLVGLFPGALGLLLPFGGGQLLLVAASGWVLSLVWAATAVRRNDNDLATVIDKAISANQKRQNTASITGYDAVADALT